MQDKDVFILQSIIEYCDKITTYIDELAIDKENFLSNERSQDLCAFYCLQIGEYANELSNIFIEAHSDMEWHKIIGLRHNIAHEYGSIDPSILWDAISKNIPELRDYCSKIIKP